MKSHAFSSAVLVTALSVLGPWLGGCAEENDREAAYPEPQAIGYSDPNAQPPQAPETAAAQPPPPPSAPPPPPDSADTADMQVSSDVEPVAPAAGQDYADTDPSALSDFRSALDPYGSWVDDPTYGTVWVPSESVVGSDFAPYETSGHWTYDDDYTWVSDYDWGWAPFHYGRWAYDAPYGWEWIPGRTYAGAWVSWRYGYGEWGYVGWAPLAPTWGWRGGVAVGLGFVPAMNYGYCPSSQLFSPRPGVAMVGGPQAGVIGAHTRPWVPATPTVNGRVAATPGVNGPSPQVLRIPQSAVVHGAVANRGIVQARAFAHAGTATALGGRQPVAFAGRGSTGFAGAPPSASHFGGKLGGGFSGSGMVMHPPAPSLPYARGGYASPSRGSPYAGSRSFSGGYSGPARAGYAGYSPYRGAPAGTAHPAPPGSHSGGSGGSDGGYFGGTHGGSRSTGGSHGGFGGGGGHTGVGGGGFGGGGRR